MANKSSQLPKTIISAVILAGGKGSRMGGVNKGLMMLQGKPMISHVIARLRPQVEHIIISANQEKDSYRAFGHPVISDVLTGTSGPLAGIYSAMTIMTTAWLACVPCDVPKLPTDLIARLSAIDPGTPARVAHDGQRQQSACCLLHGSLCESLRTFLESGHHAVHRFLAEQQAVEIDFSDEADAFININTTEELHRLA